MSKAPVKIDEVRIFQDPFLGLREDVLHDESDRQYRRKVIEYRQAAAILPMTSDGRVLLIEHYRHPIGRTTLDIPGGVIEPGETPAEACVRELLEETGHTVDELVHLVEFCPEPAMTDHEITLFTGTVHDRPTAGACHEPEIAGTVLVPFCETRELIAQGDIVSSWAIIAILLVERAVINS